MFGIEAKVIDETRKVLQATDRAAFRNFSHAAASVRKTAQSLVKKSESASAPGEPIHTRRGLVPNAMTFDATKTDAVIGPRYSRVGDAAAAHEFGGTFRGVDYPERSFMEPALELNTDRFARDWEGSIGS